MALSPEALVEIYVVQVRNGRPSSRSPLNPHVTVQKQPIFPLCPNAEAATASLLKESFQRVTS